MTRDRRFFALVLLAGLPGALVSLRLLWGYVPSQAVRWTLATVVLATLFAAAARLEALVLKPAQTLSNMLAAIREGDYSLRSRASFADDAFGSAMLEANAIAEALRGQRLDSLEASALLGAVMDEVEVAIFAFDPDGKLRFVNRAGAALFAQPAERLLSASAAKLGLAEALESAVPRTLELAFASGMGRWEARTRPFRLGGVAHRLLVLSDLRRALREEERQAWQRLIRVLSHEINNSLTPIQSVAQSLQTLVGRAGQGAELQQDLREGLAMIAGRADAVARFMASYARLARLPQPKLAPLDVDAWVRRIAAVETRLKVAVEPGPPASVQADSDQVDQALINLIANAVDAALQTGGAVAVTWRVSSAMLEVLVRDGGPGIASTKNLFVPFFTTKQSGSGIGLVLSRQIAEGHGGSLTLHDREGARGCEARLALPLR